MLSTRTVTVTSSTGVSVIGSTAAPGAGRGTAWIAAAVSPPSHTAPRLGSGGRLAGRREHRTSVLVTGVRVEDLPVTTRFAVGSTGVRADRAPGTGPRRRRRGGEGLQVCGRCSACGLDALGVALVVGVVTALAVAAVRGTGRADRRTAPRVGVAGSRSPAGWLAVGLPRRREHSTETHRTSLFSWGRPLSPRHRGDLGDGAARCSSSPGTGYAVSPGRGFRGGLMSRRSFSASG